MSDKYEGFQIVRQGSSLSGDFPDGTYALYNQGGLHVTIEFGSPVQAVGAEINDAFESAFDATIEAFSGQTSLGKFPASDPTAHTLLFMGVTDDVAEITSVDVFDTSGTFEIGPLSLITVPEPCGSDAVAVSAILLAAAISRRRSAKSPQQFPSRTWDRLEVAQPSTQPRAVP